MSHGSTDKCEPNMTPLLDLVLQLVMFFMICTNFVTEQTSATIQLPDAISAKPLEKNTQDVIILNVNKDGKVEIDKELFDSVGVKRRMLIQFGDPGTTKAKREKAVVILRADKGTEFGKVYDVLLACRTADYETVQLRAKTSSGAKQ